MDERMVEKLVENAHGIASMKEHSVREAKEFVRTIIKVAMNECPDRRAAPPTDKWIMDRAYEHGLIHGVRIGVGCKRSHIVGFARALLVAAPIPPEATLANK